MVRYHNSEDSDVHWTQGKKAKRESRSLFTLGQARGGKMAWRFGEFVLLILLYAVLRPKTLEGGARGVGASALLNIPHVATRILALMPAHALGRNGSADVAACCTNRLLLDICRMLPNGKGGMPTRWEERTPYNSSNALHISPLSWPREKSIVQILISTRLRPILRETTSNHELDGAKVTISPCPNSAALKQVTDIHARHGETCS